METVAQYPWCIDPRAVEGFVEALQRLNSPEAATLRQPSSGRGYTVTGGVAVLPIHGYIVQRGGELTSFVSLERVERDLEQALADTTVHTILLHVDSPGGTVFGVPELAEKVFAARARKPILAFSDSLVASAAYFLASAAQEVVLAPSAIAGSVGVIMFHVEMSRALEEEGITVTVLRAGEYKGEGNPFEPLDDEARAHMQETVDDYYDLFWRAVARYRNLDADFVRTSLANGRALTAQRAVAAGLADRISTFDDLLASLVSRVSGATVTRGAVASINQPILAVTAPLGQEGNMTAQDGGPPEGAMESTATRKAEQKRAEEVARMAYEHGYADRAAEWIAMGWTPDRVGREILELKARELPPVSAARPAEEVPAKTPEVLVRRHTSRHEHEPGFVLGMAVLALARSRLAAKDGRHLDPWSWLEGQGYRDIAAAMRSDRIDAGGAWVPENYLASEFIELLRPASAVRQLNPHRVTLTGGTATIPGLKGGATAYYKGEATRGTASEAQSRRVQLVAKQLMAFVPVTSQLLERADPDAAAVIRDDALAAVAQRSDLAFIRGQGTEFAPKGLRYQAAASNVIPANGTVNLANVMADLGKLVLALEGKDVRMIRPGWIFAPRTKQFLLTLLDSLGNAPFREEMLRGTLWGYPYAVTSQIPTNLGTGGNESEIYFADFADVVLGEGPDIRIDVMDQATYWDGSQWVSAAQNDEVVVRVIASHDLAVRHEESVAVLTGVTWGA